MLQLSDLCIHFSSSPSRKAKVRVTLIILLFHHKYFTLTIPADIALHETLKIVWFIFMQLLDVKRKSKEIYYAQRKRNLLYILVHEVFALLHQFHDICYIFLPNCHFQYSIFFYNINIIHQWIMLISMLFYLFLFYLFFY